MSRQKRPSLRSCFRDLAKMLCFLSIALPLYAQKIDFDHAFNGVPFEKWLAEGPRDELPWKVNVSPAELSFHERLVTQLEIQIDGKYLLKRCCEGSAVALVQITDSQGHTYRNFASFDLRDVKSGANQYLVNFDFGAFLLPGTYHAVMALYFSGKPEHSLVLKELHVGPVKNDPLPEAWQRLPNVEFFDSDSKDVDEYYRPEMKGQLHLPVASPRPINVHMLINLTPYLIERSHSGLYKNKLAMLLPIVKAISQLDIGNGALDVAAMDFAMQQTTFEQSDVAQKGLDWKGLKDAIVRSDASTVSVRDLGVSDKEYAAFLCKELSRRLRDGDKPDSKTKRALRIIILVSGPMMFGSGRVPVSVVLPESGDYVVYYLKCDYRSARVPTGAGIQAMRPIDDIGNLLKGVKPRVLEVDSPQDFRKAVARIIAEISRM